jgi:hypothetical protein
MEKSLAKQTPNTKYSLHLKLPNVTECCPWWLFFSKTHSFLLLFYKKWFTIYVQWLMLELTLKSQFHGHFMASKYKIPF